MEVEAYAQSGTWMFNVSTRYVHHVACMAVVMYSPRVQMLLGVSKREIEMMKANTEEVGGWYVDGERETHASTLWSLDGRAIR